MFVDSSMKARCALDFLTKLSCHFVRPTPAPRTMADWHLALGGASKKQSRAARLTRASRLFKERSGDATKVRRLFCSASAFFVWRSY